MNSMLLKIVDIDGSGNGKGLIKVPMMNNIQLGVTLAGIQVAEGGRAAFRCIVAGSAELSGVDIGVLNAEMRAKLAVAYQVFNDLIDAGIANAGAIAETYNNFSERLNGIQTKAQALATKLSGGSTPTQAEVDALRKLTETATAEMEQTLAKMKATFKDQVNGQAEAELTALITANKAQVAVLTNFKVGRDAPAALAPVATTLASANPTETQKTEDFVKSLQQQHSTK